MILLLPPGYDWRREIEQVLEHNGFTKAEEIEPKAGCRRFILS